jgi:transcriptional regulator with XRE-family HTH domain
MTKDEFKQRRERLGMTQSQLAETLEMSVSTISKYEIGVNEVPKHFEFIFESLERKQIENLKRPIAQLNKE